MKNRFIYFPKSNKMNDYKNQMGEVNQQVFVGRFRKPEMEE